MENITPQTQKEFVENMKQAPVSEQISQVLKGMEKLLHEKNRRYGNSALKPMGVFNKLDSVDSICIRIDDKLGRIRNGTELAKNDVSDMIGYLTLLCVAKGWTCFDELID